MVEAWLPCLECAVLLDGDFSGIKLEAAAARLEATATRLEAAPRLVAAATRLEAAAGTGGVLVFSFWSALGVVSRTALESVCSGLSLVCLLSMIPLRRAVSFVVD